VAQEPRYMYPSKVQTVAQCEAISSLFHPLW